LLHQLTAAFDAFVQHRRDAWTSEDVCTEIVNEIEAADRAEVVTPADDVNAQLGDLVVALAVVAPCHGMVEAIDGEDSNF